MNEVRNTGDPQLSPSRRPAPVFSTDADRKISRRHNDVVEEEIMIGVTSAMRRVRDAIESVGSSDVNVMITGETGVGKEIVARELHRVRSRGNFVPVNCAAIPDSLFEAELFGYRKGAFSGADVERRGLLEEADLGTLFLDEIADLPASVQAKLLRVLDHGEVRRIGENVVRHVRFRLVTATHKDLWDEVKSGRFREDLFWRTSGISICVPPLRDRPEDIPELARYFAGDIRLSAEVVSILASYAWPGNVRELRTVIEAAKARAKDAIVHHFHILDLLQSQAVDNQVETHTIPCVTTSLDDVVRWHVLRVMSAAHGNRTAAAKMLQIDPKTLWRKLSTYRFGEIPPAGSGATG